MNDTHALVVFLIGNDCCVLWDDEKREKRKRRDEKRVMEECFWQHNHTQKSTAQVKTSTTAITNGESESIAATDNDVLWLVTLLLMSLQLVCVSLDGFTHSSTSSSSFDHIMP